MNMIELVQKRLKPKVKQFGFTKKVFKSVAAKIANKLDDIAEDASEEDINTKIDTVIEESLPFLGLIQSSANEMHEEWKKKKEKDDNGDEDDDLLGGDTDVNRSNDSQHRSSKSSKGKDNDEEPAWFRKYREEQDAKFARLESEKTATTRRSKLESLLKDTGTFGNRTLKNFAKMDFKTEEEFEDYVSDLEEDLKAFNQERANNGLSTMGNPPGGKGEKQETKEKAFSDAEIDAMAEY